MALAPGDRLGPYEILGSIGRGGMGEVYRARDSRLERDVALKVIRDEGAADPERLARFRRETLAVAALNHPGILAIYDTGAHGEAPYAVMELLSGETLAERLQSGPLAPREACEIGARVADALAAAHAHGIVHRDVKPSNIFLTEDGQTKVLDFGIARMAPPDSSTTSASTLEQTSGALVGTAGYVSPEQVRGRQADARSDVFSLGAALYEAVTGRRAFAGSTPAETLSAVLSEDPAGYSETSRIPAELRRIVLRCLEKDPANRYQSARDLALDLRAWETGALGGAVAAELPGRRGRLAPILGAAGGALLFAAGFLLGTRVRPAGRSASPAPVARVALVLSPPLTVATAERPLFAISPDGTRLVYVADAQGRTKLVLRDLNSLEVRELPGTEDATGPFFSPDGQWIGFAGPDELRKLSLSGGAPESLRFIPPVSRGASWTFDGSIVYSPANTGGLNQMSAASGEEKTLVRPDYDRGEQAYRWPEILPGGKALLFTIYSGGENFDAASIALLRLDTGQKKTLARGGTSPRYCPTGHLVYARGGTLLAVPFDAGRMEVTGAAVPVLSGIRTEATGAAQYAFSSNGALLYLPGPSPNRPGFRIARVDRDGGVRQLAVEPAANYGVRFSPDGRRISYSKGDANQDVWILDLERGTETRLTPEASEEFDSVWSPDGRRMAYTSERRWETPKIFARDADGSGEEKLLWKGEDTVVSQAWSPDGRTLAFTALGPGKQWDVWTLDLERSSAKAFLASSYEEAEPDFSPDGRWIAYTSDESGRYEIYARPFPGPGAKVPISTSGGTEPAWGRDGKELFYRNGDRMMAVPVKLGPELAAGKPAVLFEKPGLLALPFREMRQYDVAPDGKSFVMIQIPDTRAPSADPILITNWFAELERKVSPAAR
ncbi:MAG: protein kinase domain-containing protein [Thermoanaerobaculia bacterium]